MSAAATEILASPQNATPAITAADVILKRYSFTTLVGLGLAGLTGIYKEFAAREKSLNADRKGIIENIKDGDKPLGKTICALSKVFSDDYLAGNFPQGSTFASYMKDALGKSLDEKGRAAQCARVFRMLVISGLLPESDYDNATPDWLTASVSKSLELLQKRDADQWPQAKELQDILELLKVRPDKVGKKLADIKKGLEGKTEVEGGTLDAKKAREVITQILGLTFNGTLSGSELVLSVVLDYVAKNSLTKDAGIARAANALANEFAVDIRPAAGTPGATAAIIRILENIPPTPDFAAWVAANQYSDEQKAAIGVEQWELDQSTLEMVTGCYQQHGRLPRDIAELDEWANAGLDEITAAIDARHAVAA